MRNSSRLIERPDQKASPAPNLDDDCQKLGVDGAKICITGIAGDLDVVIALGFLRRESVNVLKLARADAPKMHPALGFRAAARVQHVMHASLVNLSLVLGRRRVTRSAPADRLNNALTLLKRRKDLSASKRVQCAASHTYQYFLHMYDFKRSNIVCMF